MNTTKANKESHVIWQESKYQDNMGEPAILIEGYDDLIVLTQDGNSININHNTIKALHTIMNKLKSAI